MEIQNGEKWLDAFLLIAQHAPVISWVNLPQICSRCNRRAYRIILHADLIHALNTATGKEI